MTWLVKARSPATKQVSTTLADSWSQVLELVNDLRQRGNEVWVEDTQGRPVPIPNAGKDS
jgi:hypothetical protein